MFALLLGCALITADDLERRWDLDGDGLERPADCDDDDPEVERRSWYLDEDGDGYGAGSAVDQCSAPGERYVEIDGDCDDGSADAYPGAVEICNQSDDDCDGVVDNDPEPLPWYPDGDSDGFGAEEPVVWSCPDVVGHTLVPGDCDDTNQDVNPQAPEICNGIDDDCDQDVDDDDADITGQQSIWYADQDEDGWGDENDSVVVCFAPDGYVGASGDCNDEDAAYNPGAPEDDCTDPNDYNCDGSTGYADADEDGHPACEDCDDSDADVNPDATEVCNEGVDDDCDGAADDSTAVDALTWYEDLDGDGYGDAAVTKLACEAPFDFVADDQDCDDGDGDINPAAQEICDSANVDEDCDGLADDDDDSATGQSTWYRDGDADGYGDADSTSDACDNPSGYVSDDTDCDDGDSDINPDTVWYADSDSDGYGDATSTRTVCEQPSGYTDDSEDCNDGDADVNPGEDEVCLNGVDDDCDSTIDTCDAIAAADADVTMEHDSSDLGFQRFGGIARTGDLDGDGNTDIVVGDNRYGVTPDKNAGGAWAFYGPVTSLDAGSADVSITGDDKNQYCGRMLAVIDDWDGDGADQLLLGCYQDATGGGQAGAAYMWEGVAADGDIGDAELLFAGEGGASQGAWVGHWVDGAGDVDDDGTEDLLIGARYGGYTSNEGRAYVVNGPKTSDVYILEDDADAVLQGEAASDGFGISALGIGDVDGDDHDDVFVGASTNDDGGSQAGATYLFLGPVSGTPSADLEIDGANAGDNLGILVGAAGDIDDDGYDDAFACAPDEDTNGADAGACYLFSGSTTPAWTAATATATVFGEDASDLLGNIRIVDRFGDLDDDGYDDFWVGSTAHSDGADSNGAAWLFLGPVTGSLDVDDADLKLVGDGDDDSFASSIGPAGDQDGDGTIDVLIGAFGATGSGGSSFGETYVFYTGSWL